MTEVIQELESFVEGVFTEVEQELFPPRPGGLVDSARRDALKRQAYEDSVEAQANDSDQPLRGKPYFRTETLAAPVAGARSFSIGTGTTQQNLIQIVPFDPTRKRAVLITLDEPIVLGVSNAQAGDSRNATNAAGLQAGGFVLPVNVPFVSESASEIWAAATSSTATRVSVWTETYGS